MRTARFVLKIIGAALTIAGYACLIIGLWDVLFPERDRYYYDEY